MTTARRSALNTNVPLIWDVCAAYNPVHAGLYQSITNFARAIDGRVLSFDGGLEQASREAFCLPLSRVRPWPLFLNGAAHLIAGPCRREADRLTAGADLLIVHSLFRGHVPWAASWAARTGRPYIAVPHGCLDPWGLSQRAMAKMIWLKKWGKPFLSNAAAVIFSSTRELEKARPWLGGNHATVIHWPVELPDYSDTTIAAHRKAFRDRHHIRDDARVLLWLSRFHTMKRPLHVIETFLAARSRNTVLVMAGIDGDLSAHDLQAAIASIEPGAVLALGPLHGDAKTQAFHASDGFLSLSFRENFCYSMAEAMAYGLPVIVTHGHDLAWDMIADEGSFKCGWFVESDESHDAAAAISAFATEASEDLAGRGRYGQVWVRRQLTYRQFEERLREACRVPLLLAHRSGPSDAQLG
jgi:glycosyltransferase involved in cell wall biosynthesis